jgi:hypothetical protein
VREPRDPGLPFRLRRRILDRALLQKIRYPPELLAREGLCERTVDFA